MVATSTYVIAALLELIGIAVVATDLWTERQRIKQFSTDDGVSQTTWEELEQVGPTLKGLHGGFSRRWIGLLSLACGVIIGTIGNILATLD